MIFFKRYTRHLTPRELRDVTKPPEFDYAPVYSLYQWIFTISMLYSVYAPIALPFAFLDFLLAYWVFKYAVMYVYKTSHDTAGAMWRNVINRMVVSMVIFQVFLIACLKVRVDDFTDDLPGIRRSQIILYMLSPLPVLTAAAGIYMHLWMNRRVNFMNHTVAAEAECIAARKATAVDGAEETLGDRFLHPIFSQPLPTPMVDKRVRHLLPRVYRGRISRHGDTIRKKGQFDSENKLYAASIANSSTVFGSDTMDLESVMDERDRRDFDGAATPVPFQQPRKVGAVAMLGDRGPSRLARSYSVDSNTTNDGNQMEMEVMGAQLQSNTLRATGSRANLLGNAQPLPASGHSPEYFDYDGNATVVGRSASGSPEHVPNVRDTFDPIDLYGDIESRASSRADTHPYGGPGPWYGDQYNPVPELPSRYATPAPQNVGQTTIRAPQMRADTGMGMYDMQPPGNQQQSRNNSSRNVPRWE
ncbi:hypothetical protein IWW50_001505 [Coemansia erecta]|nr:hypothetical protein IWW50_001505 [Coemansia erecta]